MIPRLSIVIPTHRRAAILRQSLQCIDRQAVRNELEVIVVSDGPDEETKAMLEERSADYPPVRYVEQKKSHQGSARNRGVEEAKAPIVLFIGDDVFLEPNACEAHLAAHDLRVRKGEEVAVLGYTTWDPLLKRTRVMHWLEKTGWQCDYGTLEKYRHAPVPPSIQANYTYTNHISLRTQTARDHPFRDDLSLYGWEDMEWGLRLKEAGVALVYEPSAIAFHHHPIAFKQSLQRMETLGRSANVIARVSSFDPRPKGWKLLAYRVVSVFPTMRGRHARAFLRGMKK